MLLDEHNSKLLMAEAGVRTPVGTLISPESLDKNLAEATTGTTGPWVAKAQVLAGGRGKAGGIIKADTPGQLSEACAKILSMSIKGLAVPLVRVEPAMAFEREFYLSFAVARAREALVFTVSRAGGMDVEDTGGQDRPLIQEVSAVAGPAPHQTRAAFFHLLPGAEADKALFAGFADLVSALFKAVQDYGLLLAEINPLVVSNGQWTALDGKVEIDDNVRDLKPDLERFYQPAHAGAEENRARSAGLSFVDLSGWVGLMVNGAGLAMATMDLLNFSDLPAANFMDLGGAADAARMREALDLLFANPKVEAVFINLFGGIVSCEAVARAMREALESQAGAAPPKPLVVRMDGNGAPEGRQILENLNQPLITVSEEMGPALEALRAIKNIQASARAAGASAGTASPDGAALVGPCPGLGLSRESRVLVQGITGRAATLHTKLMLEYGARVVAGVTPFKGGQEVLGVPVFDSVSRARAEQEIEHPIDASIIFVPGAFAADAILEAAANEIPLIVCITEGIPQQHMLRVKDALRGSKSRLIGPNTPGVIAPGQTKIGIMPAHVFTPGPVAVFSRSGTLTYEAASRLSKAGLGQAVAVGIGGDPFVGLRFTDLLQSVADDDRVKAVVLLGEIGGRAEEDAAEYIRQSGFSKPVAGFVAGRTAPPGKRLGHAGAILEEKGGTVQSKLEAMESAGIALCPDLASLPSVVAGLLGE